MYPRLTIFIIAAEGILIEDFNGFGIHDSLIMFLTTNGVFQVKAYDGREITSIGNPPDSFANVYGSCYVSIGDLVYKIGGYKRLSMEALNTVEVFKFNANSFTEYIKVSYFTAFNFHSIH